MNMDCLLCGEPVTDHPSTCAVMASYEDGVFVDRLAHRECMLRSVAGGIGHHENHAYWCVQMGDPDGGRTYRQSALEVAELFAAQQASRYN
jgi:hypothetical protein